MADETLTREQAQQIVDRHGYTPGRSTTLGLPPAVRAEIKRACKVLAAPLPPTPPAPPAPASDED